MTRNRKGPSAVAAAKGAGKLADCNNYDVYHTNRRAAKDALHLKFADRESGLKLSHAERRQMEKLGGHIDDVTASDRIWFEEHPQRQHRIRFAHPCEIAQNEIVGGRAWTLPPDMRWFTIVKSVVPGSRVRLYTANHETAPTDTVPETMARKIYAQLATENTREIEQIMLKAAAKGGKR